MRNRTIITAVLALVFGASSAVGVSQLRGKNRASPKLETTPVVVAVAEIPRGTLLTEDSLRVSHWPKNLVPGGAVSKVEDVLELTVLVSLARGEPLLKNKIATGRGLAPLIPKGMRAFTIQTPHVAANIAGFLLPGNKVDVLLTIGDRIREDVTGGGSTTTLLQNIEVLAVHQQLEAPAENKTDPREARSVTLLVTPDQAAKLDLAQNKGVLHLSLRNPEDAEEAYVRPVTMIQLRSYQEGPRQEPGQAAATGPSTAVSQVARQSATVTVRTLRANSSGIITIERFE